MVIDAPFLLSLGFEFCCWYLMFMRLLFPLSTFSGDLSSTTVLFSFVFVHPLTQLDPIQLYSYSFHLLLLSFWPNLTQALSTFFWPWLATTIPISIFPFVSYSWFFIQVQCIVKQMSILFCHLSLNCTLFFSCCSNTLTCFLIFCLAATLFSIITQLLPFF
jgi:hypothetical protein